MQVRVSKTVGVLALQGDFAEHLDVFRRLGVNGVEVRTAEELFECDALVIPGGESTTMSLMLDRMDLRHKIVSFWKDKKRAIWGLCAGAIMLSREVVKGGIRSSSGSDRGINADAGVGVTGMSQRVVPLGLMDISVDRNAYGRQTESFVGGVLVKCLRSEGSFDLIRGTKNSEIEHEAVRETPVSDSFSAVFIRAPKIVEVGKKCEVLATYRKGPVLVRQGRLLACTFHPELTEDTRLHQYFLSLV